MTTPNGKKLVSGVSEGGGTSGIGIGISGDSPITHKRNRNSIVELISRDGSGLIGEVAKGHGKLPMCHIYVVGIVGLLPRLSFGRFCMMAWTSTQDGKGPRCISAE